MFEDLQEELDALRRQGLHRSCRRVEALEGGRIRVEGRWLIHLGSNDYLGLARHPRVIAAAQEAAGRFGAGAGSARLIGGTLDLHERLEEELARFKQAEAAVVFSTGYLANLGVIPALVGRGDLVIGDRLNHASIVDACRLSGAAFRIFPHRDVGRLEEALRRRRGQYRRALVATEGIFSMDGDIAPLPEIVRIAREQEAWLLLDEAHATGVLGERARGTLEHLGVPTEGILQMGTLSKALGSLGGFLAGPKVAVEFLKNKARSFIYTTAPPAASMAAALEGLKILQEEPVWRERLWSNTRRWIEGLTAQGWELISRESPIVPVRVGENRRALSLAQALFEKGVYAPAIRPPTVPAGQARIRTSITALHAQNDLETALRAFEGAARKEAAAAR